jgi:hypothetical protein
VVDDTEPRAHETPEAAALAGWDRHPNVEVRVLKVEYSSPGSAVVITDTVPSHPMHNVCHRTEAGWVCTGDYS